MNKIRRLFVLGKYFLVVFVVFIVLVVILTIFFKYARVNSKYRGYFDNVIAYCINSFRFIPNQYWPYPEFDHVINSDVRLVYGVVSDVEMNINDQEKVPLTIKLQTFSGENYDLIPEKNIDYYLVKSSYDKSAIKHLKNKEYLEDSEMINYQSDFVELSDNQFIMLDFYPVYVTVGDIIRIRIREEGGVKYYSEIYTFGSFKYVTRKYYN